MADGAGSIYRIQTVWPRILTFFYVVWLALRLPWRIVVVFATPLVAVFGALWIVHAFSAWLGTFVAPEDLKTWGLTVAGLTVLFKRLQAILTYAKEAWQYILGRQPLDVDRYAIDILISCLGFALVAQTAIPRLPGQLTPTQTVSVNYAGSISRAVFLPTFKFALAKQVSSKGREIRPGVFVVRESVEFTNEQRTKMNEFAARVIACADAEGARDPIEVEVYGFASDAKFFDPVSIRERDDSQQLNLTVANLRAETTADELRRSLNERPASVVSIPWPPEDGFDRMLKVRGIIAAHLETFFNASMDDRAAIIMNKGRVCRAQFYRPNVDLIPDAR